MCDTNKDKSKRNRDKTVNSIEYLLCDRLVRRRQQQLIHRLNDNKMLLKCSNLEPSKGKGNLTRASTGKTIKINIFTLLFIFLLVTCYFTWKLKVCVYSVRMKYVRKKIEACLKFFSYTFQIKFFFLMTEQITDGTVRYK